MRVLCWAILALAMVPAVGQEDPQHWLQRALQAEQNLTIAGVRVNMIQMGARTELIRERIWRRGDQEVRIEVVEPANRRGEIFLYSQGQWFRWRAGEPEAYEMPQVPYLASELLRTAVGILRRGLLQAEFLPNEPVAGRVCVVLLLRPNRPIPPRPMAPPPSERPSQGRPIPREGLTRFPIQAKLWIDRETGLILKREIRVRPQQGVIRTEYVRIDLAPRFSEDLFRLPPGVTVQKISEQDYRSIEEAQRAVSFPIRAPSYLPPNTVRERILVHHHKRGENALVAIRYTFPQGHFTLFQTYQPRGKFKPPRPPQTDRMHAYFWQDGDYWFGIVGNLPKAEMEKIARSLSRER